VLVAAWLDAPDGAEAYLRDQSRYPRGAGTDVLV
jgi:hypothetical protein